MMLTGLQAKSAMPRAEPTDRGFTLVEVLVALVVTSFLLVIVFDGSVTARSRLQAAKERHAAIMVADGLVSTAAAMPYRPGVRSGVTDGFDWRVAETVEATDRRRVFGLIRIEAEIVGNLGRPGYKARLLRLKLINSQ